MRIHSIEVQGFWAYREHVEVSLDGLPLVVAVGQNGTGKSALVVSSVLLAMYGKFPTRTAEESISTGMPRGTVAVEFSVAGARYRVARTYQRTGAAAASLHIRRDDEWVAVTEKGVREVTAHISDLIGMPYETAVMTWVAQQGEYGKFATAQPSERFRLLAGVYDLGKYAPLLKTARERLKANEEDASLLEGRVIELTDGLVVDDETAPEGIAAFSDEKLAEAVAASRLAVDAAAAALAAHRQSSPGAAAKRAEAALHAVRDARLSRLTAAERAQGAADAALQAAEARYVSATRAAGQRHDDALSVLRTRTASETSALQRAVEDADERLNTIAGIERTLDATREAQSQVEAEAQDASKRFDAARAEHAAFERRLEELDSETARLHDAVGANAHSISELAHEHECLSCGQHLSAELIDRLTATYRSDIARDTAALEQVLAEKESATARRAQLRADHDDLSALVAAKNAASAVFRDLILRSEADIAGAGALRETVTRSRERLNTLAVEERQETERLSVERESALATAEEARNEERAVAAAQAAAAKVELQATSEPSFAEADLERELQAAVAAASDSAEHEATEARLSAEREAAGAEAALLDAEAGRRAEVTRRAAEQAERIDAAKRALEKAKGQVRVATDLVNAYSPSGIPSMILESVIDELSAAVNAVLHDLSGGDLAVRIATTRETSSGSQEPRVTVYVETGTGTRAYEALSGGQRFRVDLAIRMGLAAVVTHGTGTPVETFILDEGWGTLDEAGIRSTLNVLHSLSERVNVLTVSHIESVRDAFPARIEVTSNEGTADAVVIAN